VRPGTIDVVLAWSGGKDSTLALAALRADPRYRVLALLTTVTRDYDRISMHGVRRTVLEAQVSALGLPLIEASIPAGASNADYETAFALALRTAQERWPGLRSIAFGDLFLTDVRHYREGLLAPLDWTGLFPLWGEDTAALAQAFVGAGYRAILTCIDTTQLGPEFAGREFDATLLANLPATVDPCGERGEFHTCVYAGPLFARPLSLVAGERVRRDARFEYCDVNLAPGSTAALAGQPK
jgi:Predicted ATPases of PP-loop superfamily